MALPKKKRKNAARKDASIARIQQQIEKQFNLPAGSVILIGPPRCKVRLTETSTIEQLREVWKPK